MQVDAIIVPLCIDSAQNLSNFKHKNRQPIRSRWSFILIAFHF
uniref:Uncharacterized protein n=1 Tax=Arundo donax TaxID=35708 RepID=A0A0A8Y366_ARUDO